MTQEFTRAAVGIASKDLLIEFRRSYELISIFMFSLGSILICKFAFGIASAPPPEVAAALLWLILFFTSILTFTTSFMREADMGTLGGLKTLPCSPIAILTGKIIYGIALLLFVECVLIPSGVIFLSMPVGAQLLPLLLVCVLGAVCLAFAGSFISGLVMFSEGKTLLLSFLLIPVCIPALLSAVVATKKVLAGYAIWDIQELRLLLAFILLITAVMALTFKSVLEE